MAFSIAIPSLGRPDKIMKNTIAMLQTHHIDLSRVTVFCVADEYDQYRAVLPSDVTLVVGVRGIVAQRQFIVDYYPEDTLLLCCDDDLADIDGIDGSLADFVDAAFADLFTHNAYLFGIHPCWNAFFRKNNQRFSLNLAFIIGTFYGIRVRHSNDLKTTVALNEKEDCERTLRYFIKDGCVIRYGQVGVKTKQFAVGGLGTLKARLDDTKTDADRIFEHFGFAYCSVRKSKKETTEIKLRSIPARTSVDTVKLLCPMAPDSFDSLFGMLSKVSLKVVKTVIAEPGSSRKCSVYARRGFPPHRTACLGLVKQRIGGKIAMGAFSKKNPIIHDEIFRLGESICPFRFTSVHLNHNTQCPPHFDSKNAGESVIVSFGDYEGCNLVVNGVEYNARHQPLTFNGSCLLHYNTPLLSGNKYSLVFYNSSTTI
jgi:hypothetical protein